MNHEPSGWNPQTLIHCVDSDALGWLTGGLAVGMLVWYIAIAKKWNDARLESGPSGKKVWGWLIAIFLVCATAGYVSLTLAIWFPKISVWLRIVALTTQNFVCPLFWLASRKRRFNLIGSYESVGEKMMTADLKSMSPTEISTYAIDVVAEALRMTNKSIRMT